MDSSRPVIRSSEPSGPPTSLQDKDKFKQESKGSVAPKKVQVGGRWLVEPGLGLSGWMTVFLTSLMF